MALAYPAEAGRCISPGRFEAIETRTTLKGPPGTACCISPGRFEAIETTITPVVSVAVGIVASHPADLRPLKLAPYGPTDQPPRVASHPADLRPLKL